LVGIEVGTTGISVGLGEGITDGLGVGIDVVGVSVGLGVGIVDGIALGDGDGEREGLGVGSLVVGYFVGTTVGRGVGAQVSQYKSIHRSPIIPLSILYRSHALCSSGGVFVHCA